MIDARPSPIAGTWYPGDAEALARSVDKQLAEADPQPPPGVLVGLIAPHAGHRYSGSVAARAFRLAAGLAPDCVAIVSPMHHPSVGAVLTTSHDAYWTPLGQVEVDKPLLAKFEGDLLARSGVALVRISHDEEHALEIELPFLQRTLTSGFKILPVMLRDQSARVARAVGESLAAALRGRQALIVASSDLSHFYPASVARALDQEMLARVQAFDPEAVLRAEDEGVAFACGKAAVAAVLWATRALGATGVQLRGYAHSGDVTGDDNSVVGYGAAAIYRAAAAESSS